MRIVAYQLEGIDLSTGTVITNYSFLSPHKRHHALRATPSPSKCTNRLPVLPEPPESKAPLPSRRLACIPHRAPAVATLPLPTSLPSRHQPAHPHPHPAYLPPRSAAVATAEKSLRWTRISCAPQLSTRPVRHLASRCTNRGPERLRRRHRHHQPNIARQ